MTDYGWTPDHLLVIPEDDFVDDVVNSETTARIRIPIHDFHLSRPQEDLEIADVALTKQWATDEVPYRLIKKPNGGAVTRTTLHPTLTYYLPTSIAIDDVPDRVLAVVSSDRGGLSVFGGTAFEHIHMRGPHTDGAWYDLELGAPGDAPFYVLLTAHGGAASALSVEDAPGGLPQFVALQTRNRGPATELVYEHTPAGAVTRALQCNDDLDNDRDCAADEDDYNCIEHPDFGGHVFDSTAEFEQTKSFALFGDLSFCSKCDGVDDDCSPETELMEYALTATSILNSVRPISAYEPAVRVPPFRMVMSGCLAIFDEVEQDDCDTSMSCELTNYPLIGTGDDYSQRLPQVWELVDFAVSGMATADRHPVHVAGVLTNLVDESEAEPGLAFVWDPDEPENNGAFIARQNNASVPTGAGRTVAHEIGHTLGLDDDDPDPESPNCEGQAMGATNEYECLMQWIDGSSYTGFMRQGNGFAPTLDLSVANEGGLRAA